MRTDGEAAIFVVRGDELLLVHRAKQQIWHVVARRLEPSETHAQAARRELREETGLDTEVVDLGLIQRYPIPLDVLHLYAPGATQITLGNFVARAPGGWDPQLNEEHDAFQWTTLALALRLLHWPQAREAAWRLAEHMVRGRSD